MPITQVQKIIVTDPFTGRVIRCNTDGSDWEEWGYHYGGSNAYLTVGAINPSSWDSFCDSLYDETNKILYLASDSKGVLKLDLANNTTSVYNVASGSLRNDACYGLLAKTDWSQIVVLHGANGISIINPDDGTQVANYACAGAVCGVGRFNNAETAIVVWDGLTNASTPSKILLVDGTTTVWSWGAMPHAGSAYTDDCDFSGNDNTLYVAMHFSSTPGGATSRLVLTTVDPATMTPSSWNWSTECGVYSNLYGNTGVVDAGVGYYMHAFRFNSSVCKAAVYNLATKTHVATYDITTPTVFGIKYTINWWTIFLGKGKRGSRYVCHTQYDYYDAANSCVFTIYDIHPATLALTLIYNVKHRPGSEQVEPHLVEGADPPPVYLSRKVPDAQESQYLMRFHEYADHLLVCNAQPGYGVTPHLFDKNWQWSRPYGLYRRADGVMYIGDLVSGAPTVYNCGNRIVRFLGWKTGGRLALGYRTIKDGEGNYTTQGDVGAFEATSLVVHNSRRPGMYAATFEDFQFVSANMTEWSINNDTIFLKTVEDYVYVFFYNAATGHIHGAKYNSAGILITTTEFNELGPTSHAYDLWVDPDGGKIYLACTDRVARYNSFAGDGYAGFGSLGSGVNQFNTPRGICGDSSYIFVADSNNYRIVRFSKASFNGTGWTVIGSKGFAGALKFSWPVKLVPMVVTVGVPNLDGVYVPPDWISSFNMSFSFKTGQHKTHDHSEFRAGWVKEAFRTYILRLRTMSNKLLAVLFKSLQKYRNTDTHFPIWCYGMTPAVDIAAGAPTLTVEDAEDRELGSTGNLLIYKDPDNWETAQYTALVGNIFTLQNLVSADYAAKETVVLPLVMVRLAASATLERWEEFKTQAEIQAEEVV